MDDSDDHQFFYYDYGEIIPINHDQCNIIEVANTETEAKITTTSMTTTKVITTGFLESELSGVRTVTLEILTLIVTVMLIAI